MKPFGELLEKLARAEVRYVMVGGGAVILHGHARTTNDLDIVIETTLDNARRLLAALATWGEGCGAELSPEELTARAIGPLRIVEDFPLDVFTLIRSRRLDRAFSYEDLLADAERRTVSEGVEITFASIPRLVDMKTNTNRGKDLTDIDILNEILLGQRLREKVNLAGMTPKPPDGVSAEPGEWPLPPGVG